MFFTQEVFFDYLDFDHPIKKTTKIIKEYVINNFNLDINEFTMAELKLNEV